MAAPSSKQERIRLNQQRSRARKQDYLQDLEKRVLDCHTTCREADLQRDSYQQSRTENSRLRALLRSLGIADAQVDSYVNHNNGVEPSTDQPSLRHLRPKLQSDVVLPAQAALPTPLERVDDRALSNMANPELSATVSSTSGSFCNVNCTPATSEAGDPFVAGSSCPSNVGASLPQYCDAFRIYFEPAGVLSPENSMLCSQARDLVEQYNMTGQDIEQITFRLAAGFGSENNSGEGCRVNKRLLFEVLNDISANLS